MDETPIFTQLSMEMCPEWYSPLPTEEIFVNGKKAYKLAINTRDIWQIPRPPWLSNKIYKGEY